MDRAAVIEALQSRNSAPRLTAPGPSDAELDEMLACALRSPDHAWLTPWRFISVTGDARDSLGELLEASLLRRDPHADEAAREKARSAPLRAPLVLIVLAAIQEHPKVPAWEQQVSAGCAAFSVLLAAEALGYAGVWRTGAVTEDAEFTDSLGADENERIVGFLYLGSREGRSKPLPPRDPADFHRVWEG
jgi:nitroreductase